jgi:hypothetical protein
VRYSHRLAGLSFFVHSNKHRELLVGVTLGATKDQAGHNGRLVTRAPLMPQNCTVALDSGGNRLYQSELLFFIGSENCHI